MHRHDDVLQSLYKGVLRCQYTWSQFAVHLGVIIDVRWFILQTSRCGNSLSYEFLMKGEHFQNASHNCLLTY